LWAGGEEFLALLPETEIEGGLILVEKLRNKVELKKFKFNKEPIEMTMSFGVSEFNSGDKDINQCIKVANEHL
jgi:diguanylate cyclase